MKEREVHVNQKRMASEVCNCDSNVLFHFE